MPRYAAENVPRAPCTKCGSTLPSHVIESRPWNAASRRRRKCRHCGYRWWTVEVTTDYLAALPTILEDIRRTRDELDRLVRTLETTRPWDELEDQEQP